jgi:hypothetical protein
MEPIITTLKFMVTTIPIIAVVTFLTSYSIKKGFMEKLTSVFAPIMDKFSIGHIVAISALTCFVSPTAAYSILAQSWREGKISEKDVIAASFLNSFPSIFSHLYSFFIPFVIPVLGWVGVVYVSLRAAVALIKTVIGLILAKIWSSGDNHAEFTYERRDLDPFKSTIKTLKRMIPVMAVTFLTASYLSEIGVFDKFAELLNFLPLNANAIAIAAMQLFDMRTAIVLTAGMLENGVIDFRWAVAGLLLGNIVTFSTRYVRHSLPLHVSLFGKLGVKIVMLNAAVTLMLDVILIVLVILFM